MQFVQPQINQMQEVSTGDFVKGGLYVVANPPIAERFWIKVLSCKKNKIYGLVDNELLFEKEHGLNLGILISVPKGVVLDVLRNK